MGEAHVGAAARLHAMVVTEAEALVRGEGRGPRRGSAAAREVTVAETTARGEGRGPRRTGSTAARQESHRGRGLGARRWARPTSDRQHGCATRKSLRRRPGCTAAGRGPRRSGTIGAARTSSGRHASCKGQHRRHKHGQRGGVSAVTASATRAQAQHSGTGGVLFPSDKTCASTQLDKDLPRLLRWRRERTGSGGGTSTSGRATSATRAQAHGASAARAHSATRAQAHSASATRAHSAGQHRQHYAGRTTAGDEGTSAPTERQRGRCWGWQLWEELGGTRGLQPSPTRSL